MTIRLRFAPGERVENGFTDALSLGEVVTQDLPRGTRGRGTFNSLPDFFIVPPFGGRIGSDDPRGAFDESGDTRARQFWQAQHLLKSFAAGSQPDQGWLIAPLMAKRFSERRFALLGST